MATRNWKSIRHKVLLAVLALLALYPAVQGCFHLVKEPKLDGAVDYRPDTSFTWAGWLNGTWQIAKEDYLSEQFGFRNFFVRLHNEIDFRLFGEGHARNVVIGKEGFLYERDYILTWYGKDYQGEAALSGFITRLKSVQRKLELRGKTLLVVLAAGKGSFYPEYFPESYTSWKRGPVNYEAFSRIATDSGLNFIDFSSHFRALKKDSPYPLFPRHGIHWSHYGMALVADSLVLSIQKYRNIQMDRLRWSVVDLQPAKDTDYDIGSGLNLLTRLRGPVMAYPRLHQESVPGGSRPSILVIADSFYWGIYNMGFSNLFSTSHFWYYNNEVYPESFKAPIKVSELDLGSEVDKHDVFVLMATEHNIPGVGWGFADAFLGLEE